MLLEDIQHLELRKSTWRDAERIREDYRKHVEAGAACSPKRCDFTVTLSHLPPLMSSNFGPVWTAWNLPGGRWAGVDATVRVRDGVVWGKDFSATISHREGYALIASAGTTRNFGVGWWYPYNPHPNLHFGRPGGCEICQALWAKVTPYASADEVRDAFAFDLSCIGATLRRCTEMSQIMPVAARRMEEDSRSNNPETPPALALLPAVIRAWGRDAETAAIARVVRIRHEVTSDTHERIDFVDYKLAQLLKGTSASVLMHETFYPNTPGEVPVVGERVIVFVSGRNDVGAFVPLTDDNLQEVRQGIAEDAVDIPGIR